MFRSKAFMRNIKRKLNKKKILGREIESSLLFTKHLSLIEDNYKQKNSFGHWTMNFEI